MKLQQTTIFIFNPLFILSRLFCSYIDMVQAVLNGKRSYFHISMEMRMHRTKSCLSSLFFSGFVYYHPIEHFLLASMGEFSLNLFNNTKQTRYRPYNKWLKKCRESAIVSSGEGSQICFIPSAIALKHNVFFCFLLCYFHCCNVAAFLEHTKNNVIR